jgi:antitoxin component of RelBE/YafQ-DinJ toxin-antitoxin module
MTNVQIAIDESLLDEINKVGKHHGLDLTQVIREALQAWLKRREGLRFEQEWIAALKKNPDEAGRAEVWLDAQTWSES